MQKKKIILRYLFVLFVFAGSAQVSAQYTQLSLPGQTGESLELFCDRSVYIVGEELFFKLHYEKPEGLSSTYFSKVIYVELIRWNGSKLAQTKAPLLNGHTHGSLQIPVDLESGNYYLRAYTKWMRNFSPSEYLYMRVKIVNPLSTKTEQGPLESASIQEDKRGRSRKEINTVLFSGLKSEYAKGEELTFELSTEDETLPSDFCLTIARENSLDLDSRAFSYKSKIQSTDAEAVDFLPELRGLSLSGKAVDRVNGQALANSRVYLSSVRNAMYFSAGRTDSSGNFLFTFPRLDEDLEFHLTSETESADLLIDTDFCNQAVSLAFVPFFVEEDERPWIAELARIALLQQRFTEELTHHEDSLNRLPFYGKADRVIYEKDFIELNDLEEFFYELVYEVAVRRNDGKTSLDLAAKSTLSSYPVLVLMDNIPVRNIDALLKVSCRRVDRIEILSRGYVLGESLHSGIVSIFSENNDMAGLKLGEDSHFFTLQMPVFPENNTVHKESLNSNPRIPYIRNTLYWNPSLEIKAGESNRISFHTGDAGGSYELTLRGTDENTGEMVYFRKKIVVR